MRASMLFFMSLQSHVHQLVNLEIYYTFGARACLPISLCLLSQPLFASVGQASARIIDSLTWSVHVSIDS